jgi:asparagine synthase (glutamine-hydrolysing)
VSGICALIAYDGAPVNRAALDRMCAAAPYRAPDGIRVWCAGAAGLSHLAFHTLPEDPAVRQPLSSEDGALTIVFDGRVDNRTELLAALRLDAHAADAAIALHAYAAWGARAPARLIGDFALAIWDSRRRELFCARDPMGVRPFYYYADTRRFVCASDIGQILAVPGVRCEPNAGMLGEYLADAVTSRTETVYAGIFRLCPGAMMRVRAGDTRQDPFWSPDQAPDIRHRRDDDYAERFRELFLAAVRSRLRSLHPIGIMLSGGVDSSAVTVAASAVGGKDRELRAFSLSFADDPEADERRYARDVARRAGIRLEVTAGRDPAIRPFPPAARDVHDWLRDGPADRWKRRIRTHGIGVVLTGQGGDTGFYGSHYAYADLIRRGRMMAALRQWRINGRDPHFGATWSDLVSAGLWPLVPAAVRRVVAPLARGIGGVPAIPSWIEPQFARRIDLARRLRPPSSVRRAGRAARDDARCAYEAGWITLYRENAERDSLEAGLEERHPFLDRRIIEFALGLPDDQRRCGAQTRYVVCRALRDLLPPSVATRSGSGIGSARVVRGVDGLGGADLFDDLALARDGFVRQSETSAMYRRLKRRFEAGDLAYNDEAYPLWIIGGTELWYRDVLKRASSRSSVSAELPPLERAGHGTA